MRLILRNDEHALDPKSEIPNPKSRRGITLSEVLVAMFVLTIGLMGILALFPLGAAQMAQAVKDERTAQLADLCDTHVRYWWRNAWLNPDGSLKTDAQALGTEPGLVALDLPNPTDASNNPIGYPYTAANVSTIVGSSNFATNAALPYPGTPVYFDPLGYATQAGNGTTMVCGATTTVLSSIVPRRSMEILRNASVGVKLRYCGLMDDISFTQQGLACATTTDPVQRGGRYNAAYLLQRLKSSNRYDVNLKVVVYQSRSPDSASQEILLGIANNVNPGDTSLTISTSSTPLRNGNWVLLTNTSTSRPPEFFADFHRIVGVTPTALSISPPIQNHGQVPMTCYVIYMENVVEVFDRGTISALGAPSR
jgi:hypothetical protein